MNFPGTSSTDESEPSSDLEPASRTIAPTQRIELVSFPNPIGNLLAQAIRKRHGKDCLRFREERLAPELLIGSSQLRCLWMESEEISSESSFRGTSVAIGHGLSTETHRQLILQGFAAVFDLDAYSIEDAADLLCAYADRSEGSSDTLLSESPSAEALDPAPTFYFKEGEADERFLAAAVENLEIGVYLIDKSKGSVFTIWNREMERLFKRDKASVIGQTVESVFEDVLARSVLTQTPSAYSRSRAIFPDKGRARNNFIADVSKSELVSGDGKRSAIVGIIQDVTNRIHSENRLIAAFNELETSKEKLEVSNLEIRRGIEKAKRLAVVAQSSNKAKSFFLSNISHELRTPLNSIVSLTQGLLDGAFGELNERQRETMDIVSDSSQHLQSLINDILDLSKIELGKMSLKLAPANLVDIARSSIRMIEQEASRKAVNCTLESAKESETADVDTGRLRQILLNLLVNAVKFTKPETTITLRIEEDSDREAVAFHVSDSGIGIKKSDFSKIFSPFTQLDDSLSRQYEGTGLGLAIASKLVELHGGGFRIKSELKKGSTFSIYIPRHQFQDNEETAPRTTLSDLAADATHSQQLVLIVDDNERSALRLHSQIERLGAYVPVIALPNEISAYHDQIAPCTVFVDMNIIGTHGSDWISLAKRHPEWKRARWIATASLDIPDNQATSLRLGFETCSCKPIPNTLLAKIIL